MANVPLYGDTPMSTTTPIPVPAPQAKGASSAVAKGDDDGSDDGGANDKASSEVVKEWGHGDVSKAKKAFRIKMDGPLTGISGEEIDGGFVIHVPGHKSTSTASSFAKNDKRLASVDVVNRDGGAEITICSGERRAGATSRRSAVWRQVEIQIGGDGKNATAKATKRESPKGQKKPITDPERNDVRSPFSL